MRVGCASGQIISTRILHLVTSNYLYMLAAAHFASPIAAVRYASSMGRRRKPRFVQKLGESRLQPCSEVCLYFYDLTQGPEFV